jgi:hypothetical protein
MEIYLILAHEKMPTAQIMPHIIIPINAKNNRLQRLLQPDKEQYL